MVISVSIHPYFSNDKKTTIIVNNCLIGAAYLVKNKQENKDYIAKKILLGSLEKNEQDAALLEVNLLKNLNHPNVVAYKTSYITQGMLIIVMEYCEGTFYHIIL